MITATAQWEWHNMMKRRIVKDLANGPRHKSGLAIRTKNDAWHIENYLCQLEREGRVRELSGVNKGWYVKV